MTDLIKALTDKEQEQIDNLITMEEQELKAHLLHANGCFASGDVYDYDNETVDVEFKYGVQSDVTDDKYSSTMTINRETMEWEG